MQANKNEVFFYVLDREKGRSFRRARVPRSIGPRHRFSGRPIENDAVGSSRRENRNAFTGGAPIGTPCRSIPPTGLVTWDSNDTAVHAVTSTSKINLHDQITGADRPTLGRCVTSG